MRLKDMSIGLKLFGGCSMLLGFMVCLGVFNIFSINNIQVVNDQISEINQAKFSLSEGRQDGLKLLYTGSSSSSVASQEDLTLALDSVGNMLDTNSNSRNFNKQAELDGLALQENLQEYSNAISSIELAMKDKQYIEQMLEEDSNRISELLEGLEVFGPEFV